MTSPPRWHGGNAVPDPFQDLRDIGDRLQEMVDEYDEEPRDIVGSVSLEEDDEENIMWVVKHAYGLMKTSINAPDGSLRVNPYVRSSFSVHLKELSAFYGKARAELQSFREWIEKYKILDKQLLSRGEPGKLAENEDVFMDRRRKCIEAVTDFSNKFSGMLTGLP
jgi:hypothetical protein